MYKDDYKFPDYFNLPSFWMRNIHDANKIIASMEDIKIFNAAIEAKIDSLHSEALQTQSISKETLLKLIGAYKLPSGNMYDSSGDLIPEAFYDEIIYNANLDEIRNSNSIRYGLSVKKISLRSFPTEDAIFSSLEHSHLNNFDRFQETGCNMGEVLLILHESKDKKWFFVKMYNYYGWVKAADIALATDRKDIYAYTDCRDFLIVTGKSITLTVHGTDSELTPVKCGMGTKLPLMEDTGYASDDYYTVKYPIRKDSGMLSFGKAFINKNEDITKGYLKYTPYNLISQALKFLDTPYDWGDKFDGKDCSGFIMTIFRCFGFLLPRNADEQEQSFINASSSITFSEEDTLKDRYLKMDRLKPGAALFLKGHVMMYLGKYNETHYMIHSFSRYGVKIGSSYETRNALCVAISPINLPSADGKPFVQNFTSAVHFQ